MRSERDVLSDCHKNYFVQIYLNIIVHTLENLSRKFSVFDNFKHLYITTTSFEAERNSSKLL